MRYAVNAFCKLAYGWPGSKNETALGF
jgi:hypothetical protein